MIQRNYLTGEQLYEAFYAVLNGKREYVIARRFKVSTPALKRSLGVLRQMLAGGELTRQKNRSAFMYAANELRKDHKQAVLGKPAPQNTTVYQRLEAAQTALNQAIEDVVKYEVDRRTEQVKKELEFYKETAKKSNVATSLQKHFEGGL